MNVRRVILLGYRGSGKSTLGRLLAQRLHWDFVDLDDAVRQRFGGLAIADIWKRFGEPAFRQAEVDAAIELLDRTNLVLALGGGTPMQEKAFDAIKRSGDSLKVYLRADAAALAKRIMSDPASSDQRPSLTASVHGGAIGEVQQVLSLREPTYRRLADEVLDVGGASPELLADRLREQVVGPSSHWQNR